MICALQTVCLVSLICLGAAYGDDPAYQFDRLWPVTINPVVNDDGSSIAADDEGNIYFLVSYVFRYDTSGRWLQTWFKDGSYSMPAKFGSPRELNGFEGIATDTSGNVYLASQSWVWVYTPQGVVLRQFEIPSAVATAISVDGAGSIYVLDRQAAMVYKFRPNGTLLTQWGGAGAGNGQFNLPTGIANDIDGNVYVSDTANHRIQKFDSTGTHIITWGGLGTGDGQFDQPLGLTVSDGGAVYVTDFGNNRVQRFDTSGVFNLKWGTAGSGPGQFDEPEDITIDAQGFVYIVDGGNHRVQKFTADGEFVAIWSTGGTLDGQFSVPHDVAIDSAGNIFVADTGNNRVQKFNAAGEFVTKWGAPNQFDLPVGIAVDSADNVYVVEQNNHRVQKFDNDGIYIDQWGSPGSGNGQFAAPSAICVGPSDVVYVSDNGNDRVQKFDSNGTYLTQWGGTGNGDGHFYGPQGIATDASGNVFVGDSGRYDVQKFDSNGTFLLKFGQLGADDGQFASISGITVDATGNVFVADPTEYTIQKFTSTGQFLTKWGSVESLTASGSDGGSNPGMLLEPRGMAVDASGRVYVADRQNDRIQRFKPPAGPEVSVAILVLGGGHYAGNRLWGATQSSGALAAWALGMQGFSPNQILLLSPAYPFTMSGGLKSIAYYFSIQANMNQILNDLDNNYGGNIKDAVVYLVDHGAPGRFRLNEEEILEDEELATWIDSIQSKISGTLTVVYDACESGSFLTALANPTYSGRRLVLTSTSDGEQAYFVDNGTLSFSSHFWLSVLNGESVADSFAAASDGMAWANQTPLLDDDSDGAGDTPANRPLADATYIGLGNPAFLQGPTAITTGSSSPVTGVNNGTIFVDDVADDEGVTRAWAIVTPPTLAPSPTTMAVVERSEVELLPVAADRWEGEYDGFVTQGIYSVDVFMLDATGALSGPFNTTVTVGSPPTRKAIIVAGGDSGAAEWSSYAYAAGWVYAALRIQGYPDADIKYFSQAAGDGVTDATATRAEFETALQTWAGTNTRDLTLCFIGDGVLGGFYISPAEFLSWSDLAALINGIDGSIPGVITVYADANGSGSMLPIMTPQPTHTRIAIASTGAGQQATFGSGGVNSFSRYFWVDTALGGNVAASFTKASNALQFAVGVGGLLDDNADGLFDPKADGNIARLYYIGSGVGLAGDEPVIGEISSDQTLTGANTTATIDVGPVTSLLAVEEVVASVTPPDGGPAFELLFTESGPDYWTTTYNGFTKMGTYRISVTALDERAIASAPAETRVIKLQQAGDGSDEFEDDDLPANAEWIGVDAYPDQRHNFHDDGDVDWVKFFGEQGDTVTVETANLGADVDTVVQLFRADGSSLIGQNDDGIPGELAASFTWTVDEDAFYLVKVDHSTSSDRPGFGSDAGYDLRVWRQSGPALPGNLFITVVNGANQPIANAAVSLASTTPPWSVQQPVRTDGSYSFTGLAAGSYQVNATAPGFSGVAPGNVNVTAGGSATHTVTLNAMAGSVTCTILPAAAVSAGAQWRLDGGPLQASGASVSGVTTGTHTVTFTTLAGWVAPSAVIVNVTTGQTASASGTYAVAQLAAPQGLQASDGTFTDRIEVSWQPVANATGYRVYRSQSWDGGTGVAVGDVSGTSFTDTTASPPTVVTPPSGGCGGGGGTPQVTYTKYVYWVQALGAHGAASAWCPPDDGYRGAPLKSLDALLTGGVYETALPGIVASDEIRSALPTDSLSVRLRAEESIDPASIRVMVTGVEGVAFSGDWQPVEGEVGLDGWYTVRPGTVWPAGANITLYIVAATQSGTAVNPIVREYQVTESRSLATVTPLAGALGEPYATDAFGPFAKPREIRFTAPAGSHATLYYYLADGASQGWHPAEQVAGLLDGGLAIADGGALVAHVRHGGVFCLGPSIAEESPAPSGYGSSGLGQVSIMAGMALVLLCVRRMCRNRAIA